MTNQAFKVFLRGWWQTYGLFCMGLMGIAGFIWFFCLIFPVDSRVLTYLLVLVVGLVVCLCLFSLFSEWHRWTAAQHQQPFVPLTAIEALQEERMAELEGEIKALQEERHLWKEDLQDYYRLWAHQMKIPIAASQLLVGDLERSPHQKALEQELFKIEQYTGLVLNYLRLQSIHADLLLKKESIAELVHESVKRFSIFFIQQSIRLDLGDLDGSLVTDRKWFALLLEQLLSNAVKYTKEGQISIYRDGADLVIRDTGIGIAASDMDRVFEKGFSGYNGRLTQKSSGLGLYLSKKIAQELGYSLALSSQLGQGTEVRIGVDQKHLRVD